MVGKFSVTPTEKIDYKKALKEFSRPSARTVVAVTPPALEQLRFEHFAEGKAAQTLHIGSFDNEGPTVDEVHKFIEDSGHQLAGRHHEI